MQLLYKGPHLQKDKLVLFLDVSGSMDKYSFFLLRFIFSLKDYFKKLEVFVFSTRLLRISRILQRKGIVCTLQALSEHVDSWSGGTRIGSCFRTFNDSNWNYLNKNNSVVIIVSDDLDTDEPELLKQELQKIKRRSKKIIWLNPLKGMTSYTPAARGMNAALPFVDEFGSAHNLDSILTLEKYLKNFDQFLINAEELRKRNEPFAIAIVVRREAPCSGKRGYGRHKQIWRNHWMGWWRMCQGDR